MFLIFSLRNSMKQSKHQDSQHMWGFWHASIQTPKVRILSKNKDEWDPRLTSPRSPSKKRCVRSQPWACVCVFVCVYPKQRHMILWVCSHQRRSLRGVTNKRAWWIKVNRAEAQVKQPPSPAAAKHPDTSFQHLRLLSTAFSLTLIKFELSATIKSSTSNNIDKWRPKSADFKWKRTRGRLQCSGVWDQ